MENSDGHGGEGGKDSKALVRSTSEDAIHKIEFDGTVWHGAVLYSSD